MPCPSSVKPRWMETASLTGPASELCVSQAIANPVTLTLKINYHKERENICKLHVKFIARKYKRDLTS